MKKSVKLTNEQKIERFERLKEAQNKRVDAYQQRLKNKNREEFNRMMTENAKKYYQQNKENISNKNRKSLMFRREFARLSNILLV